MVVCFEQELTRAHQKATTVNYPPLSVCSVLSERRNGLPHINTADNSTLSSTTNDYDQLLNSYVQDVWDKYHRCSELLAGRHKMEVESLWLVQRQQWIERHSKGTSLDTIVHYS